jgi:PilZ domain-containing protein
MFNNTSREFTGQANEAEHTLSPAPETNHRQSDRVFLTLPIRVSCIRGRSEVFVEEGQTIDISRHGATIRVDRELFAGEIVKVQRLDGVGKEVMAQVVGRVARGSDGHLFGLTICDAAVANPWGIVFPAVAEMENAVLRALLRCVSCERTEVTYLNEFEADLLLCHHYISRPCEQCGGWTTWNRPHDHPSAGPIAAAVPGTQNRRSHGRIHVEAVGCVRHPVLGNEVVVVRELARGGLSFFSPTKYPDGLRVEIAVPYSSKAPNIYSPARIVGSRNGAGKESLGYEYGVAYLH